MHAAARVPHPARRRSSSGGRSPERAANAPLRNAAWAAAPSSSKVKDGRIFCDVVSLWLPRLAQNCLAKARILSYCDGGVWAADAFQQPLLAQPEARKLIVGDRIGGDGGLRQPVRQLLLSGAKRCEAPGLHAYETGVIGSVQHGAGSGIRPLREWHRQHCAQENRVCESAHARPLRRMAAGDWPAGRAQQRNRRGNWRPLQCRGGSSSDPETGRSAGRRCGNWQGPFP